MAERITNYDFNAKAIYTHNSIVRYLREKNRTGLLFQNIDTNSLCLVIYTDMDVATSKTGQAIWDTFILFAAKNNNCSATYSSLKKSRRIPRSITAGEAFAFATGYDIGYDV